MSAATNVKVKLRYPTPGYKAGDVISVDKGTADGLVANGNATLVQAKSEKDS